MPTIIGNDSDNNLIGGGADDEIIGLGGNDFLSGQAGNDTLDGGTGDDTLVGGDGNDIYHVNASTDEIIEGAGAASGYDRVYSRATDYTLSANVERLTLQDLQFVLGPGGVLQVLAAGINGTGNNSANVLEGNARANVLSGLGGNDTLYGFGADDTLDGGSGNDYLDGGTGDDLMRGGTGNDTYIVDSANDQVIENVLFGGVDTVYASVTHTLAPNVERLVLTGTDAIDGTGNAGANTIWGNAASNTLDGGAGADDLRGGGGNDTYIVDNAGDTVTESAASGTDTVRASVSYALTDVDVENLLLTGTAFAGVGNASNNIVFGNAVANSLSGLGGNDIVAGGAGDDTVNGGSGNDMLYGDADDDTLIGGSGADRLFGGSGNDVLRASAAPAVPNDGATDTFVFNTPLNPVTNVDLIESAWFQAGNEAVDDEIALENSIFTALRNGFGGNTGTLSAGQYFEGLLNPQAGAAAVGIYNNTITGDLYYNPTFGTAGDAILFARVNVGGVPGGSASLSAEEFTLI